MRAYINTTLTRTQAIALMEEHRRLDHIITGTYGQGEGADFQGCMVGCAADGNHQLFESKFGIPWRVAWLADDIFEGLNKTEGADFSVDFFRAIPEGVDLSHVYDKWCAWMLLDPTDGLVALTNEPSVGHMGELFRRASSGDEPNVKEWESAAWDAWDARAVWAAWDARAARAARATWATWATRATRATRATWAAGAARDARAAWDARDAWDAGDAWAARAARAARAAGDAGDAGVLPQRDALLRILGEAPITEGGE